MKDFIAKHVSKLGIIFSLSYFWIVTVCTVVSMYLGFAENSLAALFGLPLILLLFPWVLLPGPDFPDIITAVGLVANIVILYFWGRRKEQRTPHQPKIEQKRKPLAIALACSTLVVLLLAILYATIVFPPFKQQNAEKDKEIQRIVTSARTGAEPATDDLVAEDLRALQEAGVISQQPIASSKVDVCKIENDKAHIDGVSWRQSCHLRYVMGFSTSLSREGFSAAVRPFQSSAQPLIDGCKFILSDPSLDAALTVLTYRRAGLPALLPDLESSCNIPDPRVDAPHFSLDYPNGTVFDMSFKALKNFSSSAIDNSYNQIWVSTDSYPYYSDYYEGYRCKPADIIFSGCRQKGKPIQAP